MNIDTLNSPSLMKIKLSTNKNNSGIIYPLHMDKKNKKDNY